jgi:hypothetical protein
MENITYLEKLKDPRWQKKRLEIFERDHWACVECGEKKDTLNVHHIFYFYGKEPWDIPNGFLITLCESCHKSGRPCQPQYKSCSQCPEYGQGNSDCNGSGDVPGEFINGISTVLNLIWSQRPFFGHCGTEALGNAHFMLRPK